MKKDPAIPSCPGNFEGNSGKAIINRSLIFKTGGQYGDDVPLLSPHFDKLCSRLDADVILFKA